MNSTSKGEVSEACVIARLLKLGYAVSIPFGNNQRYDLIVDNHQELLRAQVKTGRMSPDQSCIMFNCSSSGYKGKASHYQGQADIFLIYSPDLDRVYQVPVSTAPAVRMMLRIVPKKPNGPTSTIHWACDFEL